VHCVTEDHSRSHYLLREFFVTSTKDPLQKPRQIYHYHFTGWPDHGVPEGPSSVLSFLQDIHSQQKDNGSSSPMVVHCCNGLGRTGALIVIDIILNVLRWRGERTDCVDYIGSTVQGNCIPFTVICCFIFKMAYLAFVLSVNVVGG